MFAVAGETETVREAGGGLGGGLVCVAEPQATRKRDKASGKKGLEEDIVGIVSRERGGWTTGQRTRKRAGEQTLWADVGFGLLAEAGRY